MIKVFYTKSFREKLVKLARKDRKLLEHAQKKIDLFKQNPTHPSLRKHKLVNYMQNDYSISINMSIRAVFYKSPDGAYVFHDIGTHYPSLQVNYSKLHVII